VTHAAWIPLLIGLGAPVLAWLALGASMLANRPPSEAATARLTAAAFLTGLGGTLIGILQMLLGVELGALSLGALVTLPSYHLELGLRVDALSLGFLLLVHLIGGVVGAFSVRYLHREPGYHRFFLLLLTLALGLQLIAAGAGLDLLFAGWELVGLSSTLLIAFFHRRTSALDNGLRAFAVYRLTDLPLLLGVVALHDLVGSVSFAAVDAGPVPAGAMADTVALLLLAGAMGKAASVPFSGWLPRAMEGPTPSSAIFYGALSIHAAPFLLLRMAPVFEASPLARGLLFLVGLLTAIHGSMVGRVMTDTKSTLAYASLAQVGLIFVEIALGWHTLAMVHGFGHASARAVQLLRVPSTLAERDELLGAVGGQLLPKGVFLERALPPGLRLRLYRFAWNRWHLDALVERGAVAPALGLFRAVDRLDRAWTRLLSGGPGPLEPELQQGARAEAAAQPPGVAGGAL
jgi:NADH:ubiquinone oxidoreductase subunit 5 (subunit L)/multisubunit Na+/H+ antiporter MnhA subunit